MYKHVIQPPKLKMLAMPLHVHGVPITLLTISVRVGAKNLTLK